LWAFHGDADEVVSIQGSQDMIDAILAEGGRQCRLTVYPGAGHGIPHDVYLEKELYTWLLRQYSLHP
jgi:dipeptidyl aminopeptidase/acylaminoacyl peptidase